MPPIDLVRFADLEPDWSERRRAHSRHDALVGQLGRRPGGITRPQSGRRRPQCPRLDRHDRAGAGPCHTATTLPVTRLYLVTQGEAITDIGAGITVLGRLDGLHVPAGETAVLRNNGPAAAQVLWVDCPVA